MLELSHVHKVYRVGAFGGGRKRAVRDVDLTVRPGEVVSLIGESGSGKSTLGKMVLGLTRPTSGRITFEGTDISTIKSFRAKKEYHRRVQGVFQDPFSCFNPIFKADRVLTMIRSSYFPDVSDADWRDRVVSSLRTVRLDPDNVLGKYPHQLSGGQLQRLLIARALLLDIRMLVADEVISMLDASTRIDVLNLLADLKERGLGILFVTHDLSLGTYVSDTTVILRKGAVAEMGPTREVFDDPRHPYSRHLLSCVPQLHRSWAEVDAQLAAEEPEPVRLPTLVEGDDSAPMVEVGEGHFVGADQG
ncbi:ABC transporter ATP-binding protein [Nocardiopsis kunsanensis]|uniref:Oligopeptide ABC transporter ATP-binding protein n=1 Tax=Nocardiopsis kunsanensis TaxID=141693 RepID=A0A918X8X0_9ACTN|nr:ATP-binding cassette domain-containing protein [Nocardiopsis kunsanensis]GHD17936.1 oligopeptide ABC transporter ATP-binding protein [Nocardiopsis kunsanensis]